MAIITSGIDWTDKFAEKEGWKSEPLIQELDIPIEIVSSAYRCISELSMTAHISGEPIGNLCINEYYNFIRNSQSTIRKFRTCKNPNIQKYLFILQQLRTYGLNIRRELKEKHITEVAHISGLLVLEEHRNKKIALDMIKIAKENLKNKGFSAVIFETSNNKVREMAEKFGAKLLVSKNWKEVPEVDISLTTDIWIYYF